MNPTTLPKRHVDLAAYRNRHSCRNKLGRAIWTLVYWLLFRPTPRSGQGWRIGLLRLFGARIGKSCAVLPSCRIWAPWNLAMEDHACLSFDVDCYNVAPIAIGAHTTISQYVYLCTASHDIRTVNMELTTAPITIGAQAWVAARAFVGPGVRIGEGAVVGACAVVVRNVADWTVVAGNPARQIGTRQISAPPSRNDMGVE